jgi:hypothetical protein
MPGGHLALSVALEPGMHGDELGASGPRSMYLRTVLRSSPSLRTIEVTDSPC